MSDTVGPEDVRAAAAVCRDALSGLVDLDWSIRAGPLDWSCRRTLEHIPSAQLFYASHLALQAKESLPRVSGGGDQLTVADVLLTVETGTAGDNHSALEHCAVHGPCATLAAASSNSYPVPTFEAAVMAHAGDSRRRQHGRQGTCVSRRRRSHRLK